MVADRVKDLMVPWAAIQLGGVIGEGGYGRVYRGQYHVSGMCLKCESVVRAGLAKLLLGAFVQIASSLYCPHRVLNFGVARVQGLYMQLRRYWHW